jgi:hypothetical protein
MIKKDLSEAIASTGLVLDALLRSLQGKSGLTGARLNYLCGKLRSDGAAELNAGGLNFWQDFAACFEAAPPAGATFNTIDAVRVVAEAMTPVGKAAIAVKNFAVRMSLVEQARILAATDFVSRQDIDAYFVRINASFETAENVAADLLDNVSYTLLIALHAAVSDDLANRSRPLPRMVRYTFPTNLPSLVLAQRLYYDPSRNDELIAENKPIHPLFMPPTGVALSV